MTARAETPEAGPPSADPAQIETFFRLLFGAAPAALWILLWELKAWDGEAMDGDRPERRSRSHWFHPGDWSRIAQTARGVCDRGGDAYAQVSLSPRNFGPSKRCEVDAAAGIVGLWADIDIIDAAHKGNALPATEAEARGLADATGLPPSFVLHTGHGLQPWWLLKTPWVFADAAERKEAQDLARGWTAFIQGHAKARGWTVDSTGDLARVLRVAGTVNNKLRADGTPLPPTPVRLIEDAGHRYDLDDFLAAIPDERPQQEPPRRAPHVFTMKGGGADPVSRARAYVAKMPEAVSGDWGSVAAFKVAQVLVRGFSLTVEQARPLFKDYSDRCRPPWSDKEITHKLESADKKSRLTSGYLLNAPPRNGKGASDRNGHAEGPAGDKEGAGPTSPPHQTDLGNARRVVARHGHDLRFCHPWKAFLVWDGRRWVEDKTAEAVRRVKETQDHLFRQTAEQIKAIGDPGDDEVKQEQKAFLNRLLNHLLKWEDAKRISACLELARSEPGVPVLPDALDRDPWSLNVLNGTLDLRTGRLRDHRREDMLTKLAPVAYDAAAACPLWTKFLWRIMAEKEVLVRYLQRVVGYALTGAVGEQCLWFFHGDGANGKSTFLTAVMKTLGDYAMQAVGDLLMVKKNESHPTERADLFGKRFVATIETEQGKRMAEALMKQLTGGDAITARKLFRDFFEFDPTHKIFLAANHKPDVRGTDRAAWRRIKLVPFVVTIPDGEKDKNLPQKLRGEGPGILAWAVRGCLDWQRDGMQEPEEVRAATEAYQAEQDTVARFVAECCLVHPDVSEKASALLEAFVRWSGDKAMNPRRFGQLMQAKGYESKRQTRGYFYRGIAVQDGGVGGDDEP